MEFVSPWSSQHMWIVLHQYNDTNTMQLANAVVEKDRSFFPASTNSYISAVSLRISLFGNAEGTGYVYQYIPPDWFIAGDKPDEKDSSGDMAFVPLEKVTAWAYDFRGEHKTISLTTPLSEKKADMSDWLSNIAGEINQYRIQKDSLLRMEHTNDSHKAYIKILGDPSEHIRGCGMGPQQLAVVRGKIIEISDPDTPKRKDRLTYVLNTPVDGATQPKVFCIKYRVMKRDLPDGTTLREFASYLCSGVHLHLNNPDRINPHPGAVLSVLGPMTVDRVSNVSVSTVDFGMIVQPNGDQKVPVNRMVTNDNEYVSDGEVTIQYLDYNDSQFKYLTTAYVQATDSDWLYENSAVFEANLAVEISSNSGNFRAAWQEIFTVGDKLTDAFLGSPAARDREYLCYTTQNPLYSAFGVHDIAVDVILRHESSGDESDDYSVWIDPGILDQPGEDLMLGTIVDQRDRIEARTWKQGDMGVFTVNEMYEIFNAPQINDGYWNLNTASNGGFELKILKKMDRFQISEDMALALGLIPTMRCAARDLNTDQPQRQYVYIFVKTARHAVDRAFVNNHNYNELVREGSLFEFWDVTTGSKHNIDPGLSITELRQRIVIDKVNEDQYKIVDRVESVFNNQRDFIQDRDCARIQVGDKWVWEWEDPPIGGIVSNNSQVSLQSFALFEGIQVQLPSLPFQSQVMTYSSSGERTLLELRFPITMGTGNDSTGVVTATSFEHVNDVLWNRTGSHQWLPISSIGDIFRIDARCSLVYRDAANIPPLPIHLPPGGIFQLKIALLETK